MYGVVTATSSAARSIPVDNELIIDPLESLLRFARASSDMQS